METAFMISAPRAGARCGARLRLRAVDARRQTEIENAHERLRDLGGSHRLILAIPVRDPVESSGQGKGGHLGIMGVDRAVSRARLEELPDGVIDLGLELFDAREGGRREPEILGPHHAPAVFRSDCLGVVADGRVELLAGAHPGRPRPAKRLEHALEAREDTLEQELFLVGHVVVDRGLGNVERRRDLIERGVVISAFAEGFRSGPDHRLTLDVARALAVAAYGPWGGVRLCGRCRPLRKFVVRRFHGLSVE
jgi:hypothetical protein